MLARRVLACALVLGVVPGFLACAGTASRDCSSALLDGVLEPGAGFGGLRLGMSRAEVEAAVGPAEQVRGEDAWEYPSCGFALVFGPEQRLGALMAGGHSTLNERFSVETAEGLGIGSSREEVVSELGEPSRTSSEDQMLHYDERGVVWTLADDRVAHIMIKRVGATSSEG